MQDSQLAPPPPSMMTSSVPDDEVSTEAGVLNISISTADNVNQSMGDVIFLSNQRFLIPISGYIVPVFIVITVVTNCLVCAVLLRRHMLSPTNFMLVAIATSDMLTGIWSVPFSVYLFVLGGHVEWLSYTWCSTYFYLIDFLPTIFHTASIWLTVTLAVQRYIYICHPMTAKQVCTTSNSICAALLVFLAAVLSQVTRFIDTTYVAVTVPSKIDVDKMVLGCRLKLASFIERNAAIYFSVYYWFRVVFIHLVPCSALVLLTALLVNAMRRADKRRNQLIKQNRRNESRRLAETNYTTLMLVTVVVVFLLVEFPLAIILVIYTLDKTFDLEITDAESYRVATLFVNMLITLSYPLNFVIYCAMSCQFRTTFRSMFCPTMSLQRGCTTSEGKRPETAEMLTDNRPPAVSQKHYVVLTGETQCQTVSDVELQGPSARDETPC